MARPVNDKDPFLKILVGKELKKKIIRVAEYENVRITTLVVRWAGAAHRSMMADVRKIQKEERKEKEDGSGNED